RSRKYSVMGNRDDRQLELARSVSFHRRSALVPNAPVERRGARRVTASASNRLLGILLVSYGTASTTQLQRSSLSNSVLSPALKFGTGNKRTVNGLFRRKAIVPVSRINALTLSTGVSPGIGTVSRPIPQTAL